MYTLYYAPGTVALACHIALIDAGADYTAQRVDFAAGEQRGEAYRAINPKARVPSLVAPEGVLTEAPAILAYIAQCFPGASLAPLDDPYQFARLQAVNSFICSTLHVAHAHGPRGERWTDDADALEALKQKVPQTMTEAFAMIEAEMLEGPWVMGGTYSVADAYLFAVSRWLEPDGVDPAAVPGIVEHRTRMAERPNVQRALKEQGLG